MGSHYILSSDPQLSVLSALGRMDNSYPVSVLPFGERAGRENKGEQACPSSRAPWEEGTVTREEGGLRNVASPWGKQPLHTRRLP